MIVDAASFGAHPALLYRRASARPATAAQVEIDRCRRDFGCVKILSVSVDSKVQSAAVMDEASLAQWRRIDPRDRLAIVVSSHLLKMQIDRTFRSEGEKAFLSEADAVAWLMDESGAPLSQA
jgi:hypothetical protein